MQWYKYLKYFIHPDSDNDDIWRPAYGLTCLNVWKAVNVAVTALAFNGLLLCVAEALADYYDC